MLVDELGLEKLPIPHLLQQLTENRMSLYTPQDAISDLKESHREQMHQAIFEALKLNVDTHQHMLTQAEDLLSASSHPASLHGIALDYLRGEAAKAQQALDYARANLT